MSEVVKGLGLRYIPNSTDAEVAKAKPIQHEVMVTTNEGRVHVSQVGVKGADKILRPLPFTDEVLMLGAGSPQGLSEFATQARFDYVTDPVEYTGYGSGIAIDDDATRIYIGAPYLDLLGVTDAGTVGIAIIDENDNVTIKPDLSIPDMTNGDRAGDKIVMAKSFDRTVVLKAGGSGHAIIYNGGVQLTKISGARPFDSVAISADGMYLALGVEGEVNNAGAVNIYEWNGSAFVGFGSLLFPSDSVSGLRFGGSVSFNEDGTVLAVGCGVDTNGTGATYVFDRNNLNRRFDQRQKIAPSKLLQGDGFGSSLVLSRDAKTLVVAAPNQALLGDSPIVNAGGLYVYGLNQSNSYSLLQEISEPEVGGSSLYGSVMSLSGSGLVLAVGAPAANMGASESGACAFYGLDINTGKFEKLNLIAPNDSKGGDKFGSSLALDFSGKKLAVGCAGTDSFLFMVSQSKWRRSLPEMKLSDYDEQGTNPMLVSPAFLAGIQEREKSRLYELNSDDIERGLNSAGMVSGKTLKEQLNKIEVIASGSEPQRDVVGFSERSPYGGAAQFLGSVLDGGSRVRHDFSKGASTSAYANSEVFGDWTIEANFKRIEGVSNEIASVGIELDSYNGPTLSSSILTISFFFSGVPDTLARLELASTIDGVYTKYDDISWSDLASEGEPILVGIEWIDSSNLRVTIVRSNGQYLQKDIVISGVSMNRGALISANFALDVE